MNSTKLFAILIFLAQSFLSSSQPEVNSFGGGGLEVEYITTAPVCAGQSNGSIFVNAEDGVPPYVYDWEDITGAENPQNRPSVFSGTYFLTVSDASGDTVSLTINVPIVPEIVIIAEITHESVVGLNDGQINLEFLNTAWPWQVAWNTNPINNSQNISNLAPGNYCVTVTGANGCSAEECFIVVDPNTIPLIVSSSLVHPKCESLDLGRINLTVELGVSPITFDWADLPGSENVQNRDSLDDGFYEVLITDATGIQITQVFQIMNQVDFDFILNVNDASSPLSADGSVYFEFINGTYPLTFNWLDVNDDDEEYLRARLFPGFYCLEVTDYYGCSRVKCVTVGVDQISNSNEIEASEVSNISIQAISGGISIELEHYVNEINIYNQLGQLVFKTKNGALRTDFFGQSGIYIIQAIVDNKVISKKILIQ